MNTCDPIELCCFFLFGCGFSVFVATTLCLYIIYLQTTCTKIENRKKKMKKKKKNMFCCCSFYRSERMTICSTNENIFINELLIITHIEKSDNYIESNSDNKVNS